MNGVTLAIGITISLAIVSVSLGLLIVGYRCYYGYVTLSDNNKGCQDIYVSGLILTFLIGCLFVLYLLSYVADRMGNMDVVEVKKNPLRRKSPVQSV